MPVGTERLGPEPVVTGSVDLEASPLQVGRVAGTLEELELDPMGMVYDDLHVEARRVLDRNPEPRNLRDVAVALESMGYTTSGARALGFDSVFDLSVAVFDLTYLYYLPRTRKAPERKGSWRQFADDYLAGSWYGVPWIMSIVVLFVGRVALWSSLRSTPQMAAMVSLAFFVAATMAGGCSQMLSRKGTFYFLQKNYPLVRWMVARVLLYGVAAGLLVIAVVYAAYVVPTYGLHNAEIFAEFAVAIFAFLLSAAPLYMLRRFYTLALATALALVVTLAGAALFGGAAAGLRHAQLLGMAVASGSMVIMAASYASLRHDVGPGDPDPTVVVEPPELRVVLWHSAPYALYGFAYFVMILVGPMVAGLAYGRTLGVAQFAYPPTVEGAVDLALLDLVVLLGLVHASIERFGRRIVPLLERQTLDCWARARSTLRGEWLRSVGVLVVVSGLVGWLMPTFLLHVLPSPLTAFVGTPGGWFALQVCSFGFALVPVGMLCSQYLFFLNKPKAPLVGALAGAGVGAVTTTVLVRGGDLAIGSWGLVAGAAVYTVITAVASFRTLSAGEEAFYGAF